MSNVVSNQCGKEEKECFGIKFLGAKKGSQFSVSLLSFPPRELSQSSETNHREAIFLHGHVWKSMKSRASLRRQTVCSICDCELLAQSGASKAVWSQCSNEEKECFAIKLFAAKKLPNENISKPATITLLRPKKSDSIPKGI